MKDLLKKLSGKEVAALNIPRKHIPGGPTIAPPKELHGYQGLLPRRGNRLLIVVEDAYDHDYGFVLIQGTESHRRTTSVGTSFETVEAAEKAGFVEMARETPRPFVSGCGTDAAEVEKAFHQFVEVFGDPATFPDRIQS